MFCQHELLNLEVHCPLFLGEFINCLRVLHLTFIQVNASCHAIVLGDQIA